MTDMISSDDLGELLDALSGQYVLPMPSGRATLVCWAMPADCVCAAVKDNGHLYVIIDLRKPDTHGHARQMLREWLSCEDWEIHDRLNLVEMTRD